VQRVAFVALLVFLALVGGLAAGAAFVPAGSGLAGPAIALGYGVAGALVALVAGIVLAIRLPARALRRALLIEALLVAAVAIWIGYRLSVVNAAAMENPQPVSLS
jgi:hypothetical protein